MTFKCMKLISKGHLDSLLAVKRATTTDSREGQCMEIRQLNQIESPEKVTIRNDNNYNKEGRVTGDRLLTRIIKKGKNKTSQLTNIRSSEQAEDDNDLDENTIYPIQNFDRQGGAKAISRRNKSTQTARNSTKNVKVQTERRAPTTKTNTPRMDAWDGGEQPMMVDVDEKPRYGQKRKRLYYVPTKTSNKRRKIDPGERPPTIDMSFSSTDDDLSMEGKPQQQQQQQQLINSWKKAQTAKQSLKQKKETDAGQFRLWRSKKGKDTESRIELKRNRKRARADSPEPRISKDKRPPLKRSTYSLW